PLQLRDQDRTLELREAEVLARAVVLVPAAVRRAANVVQRPRLAVEVMVVGDEDAALAGRDVLAGLEAERAEIADRADRLALPGGSPCLAGVLEDRDAVLLRHLEDAVHVRRLAADVNRDDRL